MHDDSGQMELHNIRTEFYTKKKEMDFKENILKIFELETDKKVNLAKQQSDQRFTAVEERITQEADTTKSMVEELKQLILSEVEKMEKEQMRKLDEINSRLDREKEEAINSRTLNEKHKEELKNNLEDHKQRI